MDLSVPSKENIGYILKWMQKKLNMVNTSVLDPDQFSLNVYEDLYDLYQMMKNKDRFSISEIEAIVTELGQLRGKG